MYQETMLPFPQRELFVYRVINGYLKFHDLQIRSPTVSCNYEAQIVYHDAYNNAIEEEILTDEEVLNLLIEMGEWNEYDENQLTILPRHIEHFLKEIYNNFRNKKQVDQIYIYLDKAREELIRLHNKRSCFSFLSAEGLASFAKIQYLVEHTTFEHNRLYDWRKYSLQDVISHINDNHMSDQLLRYLSRVSPWLDIWATSKKTGTLFSTSAIELTDDQRRIIGWSSLYDNIRDLEECPADEVVEHDDALDGWLIIRKEQRDRERGLVKAEDSLGVNKNADEVFIVVNEKEQEVEAFRDPKNIYSLNSPMSRAIVKSRFDTIDKLGIAKDDDFIDVKRKLDMARTNMERGR